MNFDSRKDASDQLMEALKDDGVTMIGLYGMGGCGKTTLAMEVKKIAQAEHLFDTVIFVLVSSTVEVSRIQDKIASSLQYPFPESQEMERAQRLCMRLTEKKKILMILDDVWEPLDFGRIGIPLSEYHKGRKILITTRSEEVCISMDCQKKIYLPILSDDEALSLFQEKALKSKDTPENIKRLAISISKECKGLPIAIVAVASSLKGKQEVLWHAALNKLRSSKPINISMGLPNPYMCLKLSYDNLDTEEARSLFLLCSVFPEDYEIPVECLIRCAIGLGVARVVETYEATRIELTEPKIKLVSSCLLLEADDKHVKMHDLVRDVAHGIAKNENKIIKCEVEKDVSLEQGSIRYLWCVKFPDDVDCSNLEFLTIQTKSELSDGIFERMGKLRVLIITNKNDDRLQLSTTSFKSLTNLHCLILQQWNLRDISFVRDMKKLQSLSFHGCSLPSFLDLQTDVALTTLTDLKLLEFKSCDIESNIFEEIKRIPFLEELYIFKDYRNDQKEESVKFSNSLSVPKKLQRYGIILEYDFHTYYRFLEFFTCERTLGINYFDISNEVVKGLAKKVKELFVGNIKGGAKNMMPDIFEIEDGMNELKDLTIYDCEEIECLIDTSNHLSLGNSKIYRRVISQLMYEIEKLDEVSTNNNSTEVPSSQIKEESDKKFIEKDYGSKEVAPATSINLEVDGKSNCETYSQELVGAKSTTGSYLTDQQNPLGQTQSTVKMTSDPQAMEQNFPVISSPNMTQNIEEIGRQRTKDGPLSEEAAIKTRKPNEVTRDIRTRLEECKHFADLNDSRISLLVEAISAYPHLWKACEKFSDRFQALMLKTLTDMLLFLRSESVGSVNPDKEKEFLKLCDEAVQLGFEKSWVDEMRQRVVGRDSKLDHAKTRIGDLLKRHAHLTQELNNMKIELVSLHDYFDVPTKCFDFL
ncbi:hypothetical protein VIGAN_03012900 [Vigna angularis var. angularis]|uniref:NB-ARC domain-containing protein n=1 Tax=Vigna angularis var. angularis TaxID=157739 RepID=A0A0S3RIS1_PHAAN|nr:hypothetical protein VIGAN_03012900 [Vigna angularis var. angularis]